MKFQLTLLVVLLLAGCASPAEDYVRAEDAAWAEYDPYLDKWVDQEVSFTKDKKEAMHLLNEGRRARVRHAIAAIGSK